ncbi:hypothetical protein, partial [Acinetobacter baumannii]|uniref:hypothetical protein n=1 Tax=Acinetobacter baumannii TaxID=470 RepID=UPI0033968793
MTSVGSIQHLGVMLLPILFTFDSGNVSGVFSEYSGLLLQQNFKKAILGRLGLGAPQAATTPFPGKAAQAFTIKMEGKKVAKI